MSDFPVLPEHNVVGVVIHDGAGQVFLQQRDYKPGLRFAGWWTIFGGAVEAGETPEQAIARELVEELALSLPTRRWYSYVCPVRTQPGSHLMRNTVYLARVSQAETSDWALYEGQTMAWFTRAQIPIRLAFEQQIVLDKFYRDVAHV